jgi:hypothetical protein
VAVTKAREIVRLMVMPAKSFPPSNRRARTD